MRGPLALAAFHQALLATEWHADDANSIIDTVVDGPGYTDVTTLAVAGSIMWTLPLLSFRGEPITSGDIFNVSWFVALTTASSLDRLGGGVADDADPLTNLGSGALHEIFGLRWQTSTTFDPMAQSDGGFGAGATSTADGAIASLAYFSGRNEQTSHAHLMNGTSKVDSRVNPSPDRSIAPTHLTLRLHQNAASAQTIRLVAGYHVSPPIPSLAVTARL